MKWKSVEFLASKMVIIFTFKKPVMHVWCLFLEYATRCEKAHVLVKKKILFNLIRVFLVSLVEASASIFSCLSFSYFLDKPRFSEDEKKVFTVEEGGHLLINLTATANPPEIKYEWSKNGKDGRPIPEVADALPESRAIGKFIFSRMRFRLLYYYCIYFQHCLEATWTSLKLDEKTQGCTKWKPLIPKAKRISNSNWMCIIHQSKFLH